ncbi:hypothetical protein [Amycolatopsis sp. YIM 10]|uniref:hypothetical protein n=1 Tax=Amycolatopsis sp. YIM 10 TaxID=2653857 RepID=UPI0012908620|nr:hypothetical protein [Amycolatopsis sp. YIM 10]
MPLAVASAGLALGVVLSLFACRLTWKLDRGVALTLAVTIFACSVALVAFPLEKVYSAAFDAAAQAPAGGGGNNPPPGEGSENIGFGEAWGPERQIYTDESPARGPVLNSIVNNKFIGDERAFMVFKNEQLADRDGYWERSGAVFPGNTYVFRIYVNAAGADYLTSADLRDVVAHVQIPAQVGESSSKYAADAEQYCGFLSSSNAHPTQVWSCGVLFASQQVRVLPDPFSVEIYNNHFGTPSGGHYEAGASIFTDQGQKLGYDKMDGYVPSGYKYALYLYFRVRVEQV